MYHNGSVWYRVWSDGFIEQGLYVALSADYGTVILPHPMTTTTYTITIGTYRGSKVSNYSNIITSVSTNSFTYDNYNRPIGMYFSIQGY